MADVTGMSNQALQQEIEKAQKSRARIEALGSREVGRSGRADAVLAELEDAANSFKAAKAELTRRPKRTANTSRPPRRTLGRRRRWMTGPATPGPCTSEDEEEDAAKSRIPTSR